MKLDDDDFSLLGLPRRFDLPRAEIDARWKTVQAEVHPDRFAAQGPAAQRVALQWAVRINEAYQHLKDPLQRAAALCALGGSPVNVHDNTVMPLSFLAQQMAWREALAQAQDVQAVQRLADEVERHRNAALTELKTTLDETQDYAGAAQQVRALMFIERFIADVDARLDALEA